MTDYLLTYSATPIGYGDQDTHPEKRRLEFSCSNDGDAKAEADRQVARITHEKLGLDIIELRSFKLTEKPIEPRQVDWRATK